MRLRLSEVPRFAREDGLRASVALWWDDVPARRLWWWKELLWEPGQGWLRWATEERERFTTYHYDPPESYEVAPPLRRAAIQARFLVGYGWDVLRGKVDRSEWRNVCITDMGLRDPARMR